MKTNKLLLSTVGTFLLSSSLAVSTIVASAGMVTSKTDFKDFDNETPLAGFTLIDENDSISPKVTGDGFARVTTTNGGFVMAESVTATEGSTYINIDFDIMGGTGGYLSTSFGETVGENAVFGDTITYVDFNDVRAGLGMWGAGTGLSYWHAEAWLPENPWGGPGLKSNYTYRYQFRADNTVSVYLLDKETEGAEFVEMIKTITPGVTSGNLNGKFGIGGTNYGPVTAEFNNVVITDSTGATLFSDDLSTEIDPAKWTTVGDATASVLGPQSIKIENNQDASSQLIYTETKLDYQNIAKYTAEFDMIIDKWTEGSVMLGYGESDGTTALTSFDSVGFTFVDEMLNVKSLKADGTETLVATGITLEGAKTAMNVKVCTEKVGEDSFKTTVKIDEVLVATFDNLITEGYLAFTMDASDMLVLMDNFTFYKTDIIAVESEDFTEDFSDATKYTSLPSQDPGAVVENGYLFTTLGTTPTDTTQGVSIVDGKLVFNNAADGSYFGPASQYGNFDLSLTVSGINKTKISDADDNVIKDVSSQVMISFGRKQFVTNFGGADASTFIFDNNPWGGGKGAESGRAYLLKKGQLINDSEFSYNFDNAWGQDIGDVTLRLVAYNEMLYFFYYYEGLDPAYKDIPVAVFENIDSVGYIALCSTTNASYSIDDLSIKSLEGKAMPELKTEADLTKVTANAKADKTIDIAEELSINVTEMFTVGGDSEGVIYTTDKGQILNGVFTYSSDTEIIDDITITASYFGNEVEYKFSVTVLEPEESSDSQTESVRGSGCKNSLEPSILIVLLAFALVITARKKSIN